MYGERASHYETWTELKAYARRYADSDAATPLTGSQNGEAIFCDFLSEIHAPPLPAEARVFYCKELLDLIRAIRDAVSVA